MRKLKIFEHISLDEVIQVRGSGEDGDYLYGGWTAPYRSPAGRDQSNQVVLGKESASLQRGLRHTHSSSPARKLCPRASLSMPTRPLGLCRPAPSTTQRRKPMSEIMGKTGHRRNVSP